MSRYAFHPRKGTPLLPAKRTARAVGAEAGSSTATVPLRHRWETACCTMGLGDDNAVTLSSYGARWERNTRCIAGRIDGYTGEAGFHLLSFGFMIPPSVFRRAVVRGLCHSTAKVLLRHRWDGVLGPGPGRRQCCRAIVWARLVGGREVVCFP